MLIEIQAETAAHEAQNTALVAHEAATALAVIQTEAEYIDVGARLKAANATLAAIEAKRKELKAPILEAGKKIDEMFADALGRATATVGVYKKLVGGWVEKLEREAAERRRAAEEAARKEREAAAKAAAELAEKARVEREKAEEKARQAEAAGKAEKAEALRVAAAEKEAQRLQEAEAIKEEASYVTAPVVEIQAAKVSGVSSRESWSVEVTDKIALIKAVAAGAAPAELVEINTKVANKLVSALRDGFSFPGLKAIKSRVIAASRG